VALSNAFVVTPGGIGTILELFYTWQLAQVKQLADKPLILMGEMWLDLLKWMREWPLKDSLLDEADLDLIYLTKDYIEAFAVIRESYNHFKGGGTQFCRTYQGYRP
jgi:predicted Rossmann-fold nucleotide-binding protein